MEEKQIVELTPAQLAYLSNLLVDVFRFEEHLITGVLHCGTKMEAADLFEGVMEALIKARGGMAPQLFLPLKKPR